jgi:hypothetical protein
VHATVSTSRRAPLLTLAASPGADRLRVLQITLRSLRRVTRWVDLGCGESQATAAMDPLEPRIRRISVDVVRPISPPEGFVQSSIPDYLAQHELGPDCLVSLLDVIEHFPKPDGLALLDTLERRAGAVVLFTPIGFYPQDAETHPDFRDKPYQWHRSGWMTGELVDRGYAVVSFPQLHMGFGGFAAVHVSGWSAFEYWRWRLSVERLRMRPFTRPATCLGAWKEHVRFRHGQSWWYSALRKRRRRAG